jgi:hypothetical protein
MVIASQNYHSDEWGGIYPFAALTPGRRPTMDLTQRAPPSPPGPPQVNTAAVMNDRREPGRRECGRSTSGGLVDQTIMDISPERHQRSQAEQAPRVPKVGRGDM